jgi:RND family efflux transporter MFP subunit
MDSAKLNLEQYREGLRTSQVNETQSNAIGLANIEQAKAGLQMAEAELDNAIITAPFDGVVSRKNCALGQVVSAGGSGFLIQVVNNSSVFFEGNVSETAVTKIKKGQPCMVEVYALKKFFKGKVDSISESSDPSSRSLKVRIEMLNGHIRLLSGLAANADIAVNNYKGIVVPAYILRNINDQYYIAVPEDNKAVFKKVKLLFKDEDNAVIGGISPDQPIIARGVESLNNGDPIKEIQNNQE